jgi:RNA polymerase sigma-70 factor (ECF subfamily)
MAGFHHSDREGAGERGVSLVPASDLEEWFIREVLPLEADLMQFLRRSWQNAVEVEDLCQEVYVRIYEAAREKRPMPVRPFVFTVARNLIVDRARREQVVPIEAVADLEELGVALDTPSPERTVLARDELRQLRAAIDRLPPRRREVVILGRIEGLTGRQIADRLGIAESTVADHLTAGINALTNILLAEQISGTDAKT